MGERGNFHGSEYKRGFMWWAQRVWRIDKSNAWYQILSRLLIVANWLNFFPYLLLRHFFLSPSLLIVIT